ncbi:MAG: ribosomal protein S18-alanine N-acetyltransferase [Longimicrobiales bacterium]|jgi:ribosomal-protein-alanine N-acetyltransferase
MIRGLSEGCLQLRQLEYGDIEEVVSIEKLYFNKAWSEKTFQKLLDHPDGQVWVALQGEDLLGYVVLQCSGDEAELINIAVRKGKRKLGIGSALLSKTVDVAVGLDVKKLFLEVRSSNQQAISLYERFGFDQVGTRSNYYSNPREDAQILCKLL